MQLKKRLRGGTDKHKGIIISFNPVLKSHWIYKEFFKDCWQEDKTLYQDDRKLILKTTYKDNKFLTEDDIYSLEHEEDEYFYNVYTLGKPQNCSNKTYLNRETLTAQRRRQSGAKFILICKLFIIYPYYPYIMYI